MKRTLYWFKNNLRLRDNPSLDYAVKQAKEIIPVYVLEERLLKNDPLGFPVMGNFRRKFLFESILELKKALRDIGSDLLIRIGNPGEVVYELGSELEVTNIITSREPGDYERRWDEYVSNKFPLTSIDDQCMLQARDLPFSPGEIPMSFTAFRKKVEKKVEIRDEIPKISSLPLPRSMPDSNNLEIIDIKPDPRTAFPYNSGEIAALNHLHNYIWVNQRIKTYKKTRNGMVGSSYSSKFSPWLSVGNISPVTIYHQIKKYEKDVLSNSSTYWLWFELLWRDYFRHVAFAYREKIYLAGGIRGLDVTYSKDIAEFHKWIEGRTEDEFVNANMKELNSTGFMSNRGRQNAASYLVHNLGIDWRWGASYFESQLIDYDTGSNWGNWMYIAGVGNSREPQVFDTEKQAWMYDRNKKFRNLWKD